MVAEERKKGEEHLYREEKYATEYNINMLRCIFCGLCEEACPKDAIYLTDRINLSNYNRDQFIYTKDMLVEGVAKEDRIDIDIRRKGTREGAN
nr:4Fe-4S binding protein [Chitinophagales bacterium]